MRTRKKTIYYRRKREGLTNYKKRMKLLLSNKPRLVIRKSLNNIIAQLIEYGEKGDNVIVSAHSSQLKKSGWKYNCGNVPSAYLTGLLLGKKTANKKIKTIILDAGMHKPTKGSRIYAVVKGVLDSGVNVLHSEEILPSQERISGKHIEEYAKKLKDDMTNYKKQFNNYLSSDINPLEISKHFNSFKDKLLGDK